MSKVWLSEQTPVLRGRTDVLSQWRWVDGRPSNTYWEPMMAMLDGSVAQGSSYAPAIFGLAGSLIGGFIAGTISLLVARQAREAAEGAWIRDNRREVYDRFLTYAERLLHACEAYKYAFSGKEMARTKIESGLTDFFEIYGVVQTVAGTRLVKAARIYAYRLCELVPCQATFARLMIWRSRGSLVWRLRQAM